MSRQKLIWVIGVWGCCLPMVHATPETIFINGRIFTAEAAQPEAQAMAVQDGRIVAIGETDHVLTQQGAETRLVDLKGQRVMPGLIDAHSHAIIAALAELSPNLADAELDAATVAAQVQAWFLAQEQDKKQPFVVFGVNPGAWSDPAGLQRAFQHDMWRTQPLVLMGSDLHTAWANPAMLQLAGVDADYVAALSPSQQHILGVDSQGEPTGVLIDAGVDLVTLHFAKPSADLLLRAAHYAVQHKNKYGITAWMDPAANAGPGEALFARAPASVGTGVLPAYQLLSERGQLSAHVVALLVASPLSDAADLDHLDQVRQPFLNTPNLTLPGIKIFADGVLEYPAQSAALLDEYKNSGKQGEMLFTREGLQRLVNAADERGWLVHVHALGDRAVKETLDAFELARSQQDSGLNHSITHLQLVDPADYPRFQALQIMVVMQLLWAELDNYLLDLVQPYITETAFQQQYPARSLQQHGALIAGASDWPISSANPWLAIHHAMTRYGPDGGLNAAERLDLETMLLAYTRHAAQAIGLEDQIGTLAVGKQADFIVLDRDVLEVDLESLAQTQVLQTYFAGQEVSRHEKAPPN